MNHESVTVVTDTGDYIRLKAVMNLNNGATTLAFRKEMAAKVFERTGRYDTAIANYLKAQL